MKIAVAGSLNMDLVVRVAEFPRPGETIFGSDFVTCCGGKGANQAVGCGRLGADVSMVGCVGDDDFGRQLLGALEKAGVDAAEVRVRENARSGCALITVSLNSQNSIVVAPGANDLFLSADVERALPVLSQARVLLLQLETPVETNIAAARAVRAGGGKVILDPAPARAFRRELMAVADFITPNSTETEELTGLTVEREADVERAIDTLSREWPGTAIIKMGDKGAYWKEQGRLHWSAPFCVNAVDTVAAGDAFNAGLAVALAEGRPLREAVDWASATGALCVTRRGAQEAMPSREEVLALLATPRPRTLAELLASRG